MHTPSFNFLEWAAILQLTGIDEYSPRGLTYAAYAL